MLSDLAALYTGNLPLFAGTVFILSLIVGSFLNVVIYRLPIMLERDWRAQAADLLTGRCRRDNIDGPISIRTLDPEYTRLRLPRLQGPNQGLAEHTRRELAAAAWPLCRM